MLVANELTNNKKKREKHISLSLSHTHTTYIMKRDKLLVDSVKDRRGQMATDNMGIRVNRSRTLGEIGQLRLKRIDKALTRFIIIVVETNLRILHPCFPFERKKNNNIDYPNDFRTWWHTPCCFFLVFFFLLFSRGIVPEFILRSSSSCLQHRNGHSSRSKNARAGLRFSWKICIVRLSIRTFLTQYSVR